MTATIDSTTLEVAAPAGDVAAALDAAEPAAHILDGPDSLSWLVARRTGHIVEIIDSERLCDGPRRPNGTVQAVTADGFVTAVERRHLDETTLYADPEGCGLVAVINDDHFDRAGWRDHRVNLSLRPTPEWLLWSNGQGLHGQEKFAEIIEAGQDEIVDPTAAEMLDLAQTFHASTTAKFRQAGRLSDGRTQFVYEEDVHAAAGEAGNLSVPQQFTVAVRPFYGADRYKVVCRLRYRLRGGELTIGYQLHRPDDVRRDAFEKVVDVVAHRLDGTPLVHGTPASPR